MAEKGWNLNPQLSGRAVLRRTHESPMVTPKPRICLQVQGLSQGISDRMGRGTECVRRKKRAQNNAPAQGGKRKEPEKTAGPLAA